MPSKCFIKGCPTGSKRKVTTEKKHLFCSPKDPEMFARWNQACNITGRQLKKSSKICHRHFTEDDFRKETVVHLPDGDVLSAPLSKWYLKPHSVPSIFDNNMSPAVTAAKTKRSATTSSDSFSDVHVKDVLTISLECFSGLDQSGHEHKGTSSETESDVEDELREADNECITPDVDNIMTLFDPNKYLEVTMTSEPSISNQESVSNPVVRSTGIGQSHQTTPDGSAQLNEVKKDRTRWKKKAKTYETLYQRWKSRFYRLNKKHERSQERRVRDGVFIPYSNLDEREIMYANALARKANTKSLRGMRYTKRHLLESVLAACHGRKHYNLMRNNSVQVMPSYRTVQRLKRSMLNSTDTQTSADG